MTKKAEKYAAHYRIETDTLKSNPHLAVPMYHVQAFSHPDIPVITDEAPDRIQFYHWGLIPFWVKDVPGAMKISRGTINARGEEMFEKPAFRQSAASRRCLVVVDGFYEHHWLNGKSYPFYIELKSEEPFSLAGLWDCWRNEAQGITRYSVSIVTTEANALMSKIHNNPKASATPRMPVIIPAELEKKWITPPSEMPHPKEIKAMIAPYDATHMKAHPVGRLRGKAYTGNSPVIKEEMQYTELSERFWE